MSGGIPYLCSYKGRRLNGTFFLSSLDHSTEEFCAVIDTQTHAAVCLTDRRPLVMKSYTPPKLRQIIAEAIFRRKRIFLLTVGTVVGLVALATLLMHKKYRAEAKLMVQNVRSLTPLSTNPSDRVVSQNDVSATEINSEVDLLQSQGVARRALNGEIQGLPQTAQDTKVRNLQRRLGVDAVHQTNLIDVTFLGNSPDEAAAQLRKVLDAFFEERAGTGRSSGAAQFFDQQAQEKAKQLDTDQKALTDYEVAHGIADLDDQKKMQVQTIATLQDQLTQTETALARQSSQRDAQQRQLSATPQRTKTVERTITNQYSQERFATTLVELENRRSELLKRYPPTDRQVVEINEKIATTQKAMQQATAQPAGEQATDVNPIWQQLNSAVVTSNAEVHGLGASRAELQGQLAAAKQRLKDFEESTSAFDALKRKVAQSQADYTVYAQRRDEAHVAAELDKAKMFDVSLVQAPVAAADPVRPKPLLYLSAGLAFALLLSTALALYADTSAEQVYTPTQLDSLTGTRTVATFADAADPTSSPENNRIEYRRVLFAIRSALGMSTDGNEAPELPANTSFESDLAPMVSEVPAGHCVAFTAASRGEGVSHLVSNLAEEASRQASSRVAVLDMADLLKQFETEEDLSFALKYLSDKQYWTMTFSRNGHGPGVPLRYGGTQGQFSARICPLLMDARKEFDFLFLDCPSFAESTLAGELDMCLDGYVAIVGAGKARKRNLAQMSAVLKEGRAPLLGYVLNRRRYPVPGWVHRLLW